MLLPAALTSPVATCPPLPRHRQAGRYLVTGRHLCSLR